MDPQLSPELEFERWLVDSAREDSMPSAPEAWANFSAAAGALAAVSSARSGHVLRLFRAAGVRWALVGAACGSAVTAAWMSRHEEEPGAPAALVAAPRDTPEAATPTSAVRVMQNAGVSPRESTSATTSSARAVSTLSVDRTRARAETRMANEHRSPEPRSAEPRVASNAASPASLAEEVAALDAIRTAMAVGDYRDAVRQVDAYRRAFAGGELTPDAEVLAIEALSKAGDTTSAERRAASFLAKYPDDPHALRIEKIAERSRF